VISALFMFAMTALWQKASGAGPTDGWSNHCVQAALGCACCLLLRQGPGPPHAKR
jgi:hypothetical protein